MIQIGLAVTREQGIPIFHKTFPGNIHDSRTFSDVSTELSRFGITEGVAVMDRGISSSANTDYLNLVGGVLNELPLPSERLGPTR